MTVTQFYVAVTCYTYFTELCLRRLKGYGVLTVTNKSFVDDS